MTRVLVCLDSPYEFWRFGERHTQQLHEAFPALDVVPVQERDVPQHLDRAHVYFGWNFPAHWVGHAPHLRWVACPAAGLDYLPTDELRGAGIALTRGLGYHGRPMAEHALGLLLGFSRGLFLSRHLQTRETWWQERLAHSFFDLHGETLVIVGCGEIGQHLADIVRALGMQVIGVRRNPPQREATGIEWMRTDQVHEALSRGRAVVNLLPATQETHRFFGRPTFGSFRPSAVFVNLGRASTVDHTALLNALDTGRLGAAALDVVPSKPPPPDDPLRHHPRVVLTPKTAVFSHSYMDEAVAFFERNLHRYLTRQPMHGTVLPLHDGGRHVR
ncbi:D-2-hydroxyacid dehydrogenase [Streptomyces jumonjinensis]|uniref:D-2-hydroxyacid dehydrogenase n=1 Tax=Streptomyces jumonjinensis TaxID=1945 RepID=UPI00378BC4F3